jgi:hypothetical protein
MRMPGQTRALLLLLKQSHSHHLPAEGNAAALLHAVTSPPPTHCCSTTIVHISPYTIIHMMLQQHHNARHTAQRVKSLTIPSSLGLTAASAASATVPNACGGAADARLDRPMLPQLPLNCRCIPVSMLLLRCMDAAPVAGCACWGRGRPKGPAADTADLLLWDAAQLAARPLVAAGRAVSIIFERSAGLNSGQMKQHKDRSG